MAAPVLTDVLPPPKQRGRVMAFVYRNPTIVIGGTLLSLMILMAIFAPLLFTVDPTALAPARRTREPSAQYWFGSDMLGRDVYSRVIYGARISLIVGFSVALFASILGHLRRSRVGVQPHARFHHHAGDGRADVDSPILLAIALMALTRASVQNVIIAISIADFPRVSRLIRGVVLTLREQPYVEAAIASGTSDADDHHQAHLAEHVGAADGERHIHLRIGHDHRGVAVVHRCRHAADHPKLGQHHGRGPRALAGKPYIVFFPAIFCASRCCR